MKFEFYIFCLYFLFFFVCFCFLYGKVFVFKAVVFYHNILRTNGSAEFAEIEFRVSTAITLLQAYKASSRIEGEGLWSSLGLGPTILVLHEWMLLARVAVGGLQQIGIDAGNGL